jgi:hypothetical protein
MARHHLLTVWNPAYEQDAMELHLRVLRDGARAYRKGECREEDVVVWWGKIRSPNRQQPLPHLDQILAIDTELARDDLGPETHLYLTDYRSLYVAHVAAITTDDPRDDDDERTQVPHYYLGDKFSFDCWFQLWDIRRLVSDDTISVVRELKKLRSVAYHDRPVSIYGGMVNLPLLVRETEPVRWFDAEFRDMYIGDRFWMEYDAEHIGIGRIERELRENVFGDLLWAAFDPTTRSFIAAGEKIWRDHADDPAFDFSPVILEFSKALEVRTNRLLREALVNAPADIRCTNQDGRTVDVTRTRPLSVAGLAHFIRNSGTLVQWLRDHLVEGVWFVGSLPVVLDALVELRNNAAHSGTIERDEAGHWRRQLMGVGCEGDFVRLGKVRAK